MSMQMVAGFSIFLSMAFQEGGALPGWKTMSSSVLTVQVTGGPLVAGRGRGQMLVVCRWQCRR